MKSKEKITDVFKVYFQGQISEETYKDLYKSLSKVDQLAKSTQQPLDNNNEQLRSFVEKFYSLKRDIKESYRLSVEKANSLEEQLKPLKIRIWEKLRRRQLVKLYSNCNKFEQLMLLTFGVYMAGLDKLIQQEKGISSDSEL
ncbi:MAG: hypothetical protein J6A28_02630 [Clostridia bacterium]|nr:hypothetical protein [Clostridia bacterium]